jgi:hypothetical protein
MTSVSGKSEAVLSVFEALWSLGETHGCSGSCPHSLGPSVSGFPHLPCGSNSGASSGSSPSGSSPSGPSPSGSH